MTKKGARAAKPATGAVPDLAKVAGQVPMGRASLLGFADAMGRLADAAPAPAPVSELHLVSFLLDREAFGVPIVKVREVIRVTEITRVPQSPPHIRGVTNLRGRILPVVELRSRLGLPPATVTPRSRIVIVEAHGRVLGILVDAVLRVVKIPADAIAPPPEEVLSARTEFISGVARLGQELIILLDLEAALLLQEEDRAAPAPAR